MRHSGIQHEDGAYVLRNPAIEVDLPASLFEPASSATPWLVTAADGGRRSAWFLHYAGLDLVLRHYWRGGMVARFIPDVYLWAGLRRTRPMAEYRLLQNLRDAQLPVPEPAAVRVVPGPGPTYRGDLITRRLLGSVSFADFIAAGDDDRALWEQVGFTIARFHRVGAFHADLNVRNILIDRCGQVWLIDWDRGVMRGSSGQRAQRNLRRLRRSLSREDTLETRAQSLWRFLISAYSGV